MSDNLKVLQVFIASPNDLVQEREAIKEVADSLNAAFGQEVGLQIQLLGWEDRLPGYGRPQAQINEDVDKADLFVGFLWRRWGSDTGNPEYTSGFEEEFKRAQERRERSDTPEICLFFKNVDEQSLRDPGDQLKRVLEFQRTVIQSKKVLFRNFRDVADWKEQTRELLQRHLLKLLGSLSASHGQAQPQAPPQPSTKEPKKVAAVRRGKSSTPAGNQQVVQILDETLEAVKAGELSKLEKTKSLDKIKIARFGLAAAAITNRDIEAEMPGVHLTNILYKNRKQVELTRLEWLLIFRANLVPEIGYHPGWFWLRKNIANVKGALIHLACYDEHAFIRKATISYVRELGIPLHNSSPGRERLIDFLCSHSDENTRKSALEYLSGKGSKKDLALVEKLRTDPDDEVRRQADLTRNAILLRDNASQFFESSVLTSPWVSDGVLGSVQEHGSEIKTEVLKKALAHPDSKVQGFVATELVERSAITLEEIKALNEGEGVSKVFRAYYLKAINSGQKFQPQEIRETMKPKGFGISLLGDTRVHAEIVVAELFNLYTYEELRAVANSESDDAPIAYRVLAEKHFTKFGETVRTDLKSEFAALKARSKTQKEPSSGSFSWTALAVLLGAHHPNIADFATAGLLGLASNGTSSDRELLIPYLDHESERVRIAAITALRRLGTSLDADRTLQIAEEATGEVAEEAAKTALALAPGEMGSANHLLRSGKRVLVRLAILSLIGCEPNKLWPQIKDRLYDENEEIRKMVSAYAIKNFPVQRLAKLLDTYISKDRYFYNVVYFLDRAIYAKLPLRRLFIKEIEAVFD